MSEIVTTIVSVVGAFGGLELVKWLYNRKSGKEVAKAEAEKAKVQAGADEYHLLKERLDHQDEQLMEFSKMMGDMTKQALESEAGRVDQIKRIRELTEKLLDKEEVIGELKAENSRLLAERAMKLCEVRGCAQRVPQSGY